MIFRKYNTRYLAIALAIAALVPIIITAFEVIFTENESVIFLGNYHPKIVILVVSYYVLLIMAGIFWFIQQLVFIARLKNEQATAELMLLKNQVNPHFFFNILNSLYGLVSTDTQKAQQLILKLSDMMRYSIYNGQKDTVTLKEEVEYLKNYIELHKMRYHKQTNISIKCSINETLAVTPLLFIILLENAFKHGVENIRNRAYININIVTFNNEIRFTIENNFDNSQSNEHQGIGLKNLKRRLELVYPGRHTLLFSITDSIYNVQLSLIP